MIIQSRQTPNEQEGCRHREKTETPERVPPGSHSNQRRDEKRAIHAPDGGTGSVDSKGPPALLRGEEAGQQRPSRGKIKSEPKPPQQAVDHQPERIGASRGGKQAAHANQGNSEADRFL